MPVVTVLLCYFVLAYGIDESNINGIVSPLIFVGIMSYYVSLMFSEIFSMTIETILNCYIADEEMFSPADRFGEGGLRAIIQQTAQSAAANKIGNSDKVDNKIDNLEVSCDNRTISYILPLLCNCHSSGISSNPCVIRKYNVYPMEPVFVCNVRYFL